MSDEIRALFDLGLGPHLTPLRGKCPVLDAWQSLPAVDEDTVRGWHEAGMNLGFRTGPDSGLIVIDDDQSRSGGGDYEPPPTGLVAESPTGSRHYYYTAPDPCPGNSASKIAPHVDVRGKGGQVVVPPSIHPTARRPYRWVKTGDPAPFPADCLPKLTAVDMTAPIPAAPGYAQTALVQEAARVRTAPEGSRNDALNRAAFSLGQLVAGGALSREDVEAELLAAAQIAGLESTETHKTIRSGLAAGGKHPRTAPQPAAQATATRPPPSNPTGYVLVPGSHVLPGGEYVEQGTHDFAGQVLAQIDPEALYRRGGQLGEVYRGSFVPCPVNRLRAVVDASVPLRAGKEPKSKDGDPVLVFRTCSRDLGAIISDYGQIRGDVRDLRHIATYPVCIGDDFRTAEPGWNADAGVYLDAAEVPTPLPLPESKAVLEDLVCDFPFQSPADFANLVGLMLTPILRPALDEPVPMHLVLSPIERTGKSKLVEIVVGIAITGDRIPAFPLPEREEERAKSVLSVLLGGQTLWHLDNLTEHLGSATLASLITSSEYQGRILGASAAPVVPNGLTIVGSGNNVHATGEITKRIVPIRLMPDTEAPETRTDFRHPDLKGFVAESRPRILAALLGLIENWRESGRPLHKSAFGGFERWTAVVGGIVHEAGYTQWLTTMGDWRGEADDTGGEDAELVRAWFEKWRHEWVAAADLFDLADSLGLYGWLASKKNERAQKTSFGMKVLNRIKGRVVALPDGLRVRIQSDGVGARRKMHLECVM